MGKAAIAGLSTFFTLTLVGVSIGINRVHEPDLERREIAKNRISVLERDINILEDRLNINGARYTKAEIKDIENDLNNYKKSLVYNETVSRGEIPKGDYYVSTLMGGMLGFFAGFVIGPLVAYKVSLRD